MIQFRMLGPLDIRSDQGTIRPGGRLRRKLLMLLLANANQLVLTDTLIEELWPDGQPSRVENALQAHVSRLRQVLSALEPGADDSRLITYPSGYQVNVGADELDTLVFARGYEEIRYLADVETAANRLREILRLWRGPVLGGGVEGPTLEAAATRYRELHLAALELLFDCELQRGNHVQVISELRQVLAQHPYQERLWQYLMLALYRSGRQADALRVYRDLWRRLSEDMGLEPTPAMREYERAILSQDPRLEAPHRHVDNTMQFVTTIPRIGQKRVSP